MCAFIWKWPVIFRFVIVRYIYCYCYSLVHIYIYISKYICIHVYIYIYMCVCIYVRMHTYISFFILYMKLWDHHIYLLYTYIYIYVSYLSCILYVKINGEWWDKWLTWNLNIKQKVKLEQLYKVGSKCESNLWHDRESERSSVVVSCNSTQVNFLQLLLKRPQW